MQAYTNDVPIGRVMFSLLRASRGIPLPCRWENYCGTICKAAVRAAYLLCSARIIGCGARLPVRASGVWQPFSRIDLVWGLPL
jgi:hypothetical protein